MSPAITTSALCPITHSPPSTAPSVTVMTDPSSLRVLDDPAYNQFSITCTASADAGGTAIALEVIAWERRVGTESFQPVPTSSYTRTGDAVTGYESVLMGTETTVATIQFRCTAALAVGSTVGSSGTTILTVTGENSGAIDMLLQ